MIYTKGKLVKESGVETYYFLISSKKRYYCEQQTSNYNLSNLWF